MNLKTDYLDDVLDSSQNQLRKYNMIHNEDGTVSFVDVSKYSQNGDNFGAKDINDTNVNINANTENLAMLESAVGFTKKNFLKNNATTITKDGLTYTINSDKSVRITGQLTSTFSFINLDYVDSNTLSIPVGDYIVSSGVSNRNVKVEVIASGATRAYSTDVENKFSILESDTNSWGRIAVYDTNQLDITVYPMIRYARIEDSTYEPYVPSILSGVHKWIPNATTYNAERCRYTKTKDMLTVWFVLNLATEVNINTKSAIICNDIKNTFGLANFNKGASDSNYYALNIVNAGASYTPPTLLCIAQNNRLLIQYSGCTVPTTATIYGQISIPIY